MRDDLRIRPATPDDVPVVHGLILELAEYERLASEVVATEARIRDSLFGPRAAAECVLAEIDGAAAGYALFFTNFSTFVGLPGLYLEDVFVRPAFRGRGIGASLLRHLANLALERGYDRVDWVVLDWNESAITFYDRLGARPMDGWTVYRLDGAALRRVAGEERTA